MADYLAGKVVVVFGGGADAHRGVAVALAQAGADIAVAGLTPDLPAEAALHSISNEIWALGRRSTVVTLAADDAPSFAAAIEKAKGELGRADVVVRADAILNA
jgi:meso-butanediol dehydrogenase / (S,S)-butanediol dehydrogenase / diacetyl reductase